MKISWTKGLEKEARIDVTQNYKESVVLRKRLIAMLEEKIDTSAKKSRSETAYESPNWAYMQADARGYERALSDVISLLIDASVHKPQ